MKTLKIIFFMVFVGVGFAVDGSAYLSYTRNSWEQNSGKSIGTEKIKIRVGSAGLSVGSTAGTTMVYFKNDGKVGIGTASPGSMIAVTAPVSTDSYISMDTISTNVASGIRTKLGGVEQLVLYADSTQSGLFGRKSVPMVFRTSDVDRVWITAAGNFGVGSGSISDKLHVAGSIRSTTYLTSTTAYADRIQARSASGLQLYEDGGAGVFVADGGDVGIGTTGPDRKLDILDNANPQLRLTHTDGTVYAEMQGLSTGDLRLTGSSGKVGINTAPDERLHILAPTGDNGYVKIDTVDAGVAVGIQHLVDGTELLRTYADSTQVGVLGLTALPFIIKTNNLERIYVTSAGSVGIGTSTPSVKFSVASTSIQIVTSSSYTALQACAKGSFAYDESYFYVCSSAGMKRVTLGATW